MTVARNGGQKAEINMTPMIDVLLVLIIIFMVITPVTSSGLHALIPQTPKADDPVAPARHDIVISVGAHGAISLNQESMDLAALQARPSRLFNGSQTWRA